MKSAFSIPNMRKAAVALGVTLSGVSGLTAAAPSVADGSAPQTTALERALSAEDAEFERFDKASNSFVAISVDEARSLAFNPSQNVLSLSIEPQSTEPKEPDSPLEPAESSVVEGDPPTPVTPDAGKKEPVCFVKFPGSSNCMVSPDIAISLAKRAISVALLKNPAGLVAFSAYRALATEDSKKDILLDTIAGQGVSAATAISIGRSAASVFEPDLDPSLNEVIGAVTEPFPDSTKSVVATSMKTGIGLMALGDAVSSKAGPVAGLVQLGMDAGAPELGRLLGVQPEVIKDSALSFNVSSASMLEDVASKDMGEMLVRNSPSFIESGSLALPGSNKVFERQWGEQDIARAMSKFATDRTGPSGFGLKEVMLRDFIYESEVDGQKTYVGFTSLSLEGGNPLFERETGPFSDRQSAFKAMNEAASSIMQSEPFRLMADGFKPLRPSSFAGFDGEGSTPLLPEGATMVRSDPLPNGDLKISTVSKISGGATESLTSIYDKIAVDFLPKDLTEETRNLQLLKLQPKEEISETRSRLNVSADSDVSVSPGISRPMSM